MSSGNWLPAYCEQLQSYILEEFHKWRKENNLSIEVKLDGIELNNLIARAKRRLYEERPEAKDSGFKDLDV